MNVAFGLFYSKYHQNTSTYGDFNPKDFCISFWEIEKVALNLNPVQTPIVWSNLSLDILFMYSAYSFLGYYRLFLYYKSLSWRFRVHEVLHCHALKHKQRVRHHRNFFKKRLIFGSFWCPLKLSHEGSTLKVLALDVCMVSKYLISEFQDDWRETFWVICNTKKQFSMLHFLWV